MCYEPNTTQIAAVLQHVKVKAKGRLQPLLVVALVRWCSEHSADLQNLALNTVCQSMG
jgi:hypothetical protein